MEKINLNGLELSRLVHGHWRQRDWNLSARELLKLAEQAIELGVTTFDHADIYGLYTCEKAFGDALKLKPELRKEIRIVTKCGIKLISGKFPGLKIKHYDYSFRHIVSSAKQSLKNFGTDHIDLLLLHRPAPFFNPEEAARAFSVLKKQGKVLHFGVSNFSPMQFEMLDAFCEDRLVTNQVEISPYCLEHFDNGNIDFFLKNRIKPMAWSPLAGGRLLKPGDTKGKRILQALQEIREELNADTLEKVIYAWLLNHPVSILPIIGSGKIERIKIAVDSLSLHMTPEQWYRIYNASRGEEVP